MKSEDKTKTIYNSMKDASLYSVISLVSVFLSRYLSVPAVGGETIALIAVISTLGGIAVARAIENKNKTSFDYKSPILTIILVGLAEVAILIYIFISEQFGDSWLKFCLMSFSAAAIFMCFGLILHASHIRFGVDPDTKDTSTE